LRFTLEEPNNPGSFSEKPKFGLGQYVEDKFNQVYQIVEDVCKMLFDELRMQNSTIVL